MNKLSFGKALFAVLAILIAVTAQGQNDLSITERLQRVEDELAIKRVLVEYSATQDARDFQAYANLFAREGEWINGDNAYKGRAAIHQMLIDLYGEPPADFVNNDSYHISTNFQIDLQGDRATARSRHLLIMRGSAGEPTPMLGGRYEDDFIREDGEWKILRRVDYPVMPTQEEWMQFIRTLRAGD